MSFQQDPSIPPAALSGEVTLPAALAEVEVVQSVRTPIRMEYTVTPGFSLSAYLKALGEKRILGDKCPDTGQVFIPPRGVSPVSGKRTTELVDLADRGYVESFNVTRIPVKGRDDLKPPYVSAWVVPDGASVGTLALVAGIEPEKVYIGMRVQAVWRPDEELKESADNILYWEPSGEPDVNVPDLFIVGRLGDKQTVPTGEEGDNQ